MNWSSPVRPKPSASSKTGCAERIAPGTHACARQHPCVSTTVTDDTAARAIEIRREIHRHPELGFEEHNTQAIVERELTYLRQHGHALPERIDVGTATGVVGVVRGALPGHVSGLRADMDALPINEDSGEACSSQVAGKMHACGHDAHTAMLLGAARELQRTRDTLHGSVVLLFQPAEEGPGGALPMIEQGALDHVDRRVAHDR